MVCNLWVYVYWFVCKTHFRHTVALAPENVAVRGLITSGMMWHDMDFTAFIWQLQSLLVVGVTLELK